MKYEVCGRYHGIRLVPWHQIVKRMVHTTSTPRVGCLEPQDITAQDSTATCGQGHMSGKGDRGKKRMESSREDRAWRAARWHRVSARLTDKRARLTDNTD
jgi:hypothetical protein